ncbi:MAG: cell envelope integrity protein CreD [Spirochaetales bacterium]|nr:cell envelope integrity protein CreD [Spirochaetales bacterium]
MSLPDFRRAFFGPGFKALAIAFLVIVFLIPLALVGELVDDRMEYRDEAVRSIVEPEGGRPALLGPYLLVPWTRVVGKDLTSSGELLLFPARIGVKGALPTEARVRGLFEAPVLRVTLDLDGAFDKEAARRSAALPPGAVLDWARARLRFELPDTRSLAEPPRVSLGGADLGIEAEPREGFAWDCAIGAAAPLESGAATGAIAFSARVVLRGGLSFRLLEPAGEVSAALSGNWPSPSFRGFVSPVDRSLDEDGFSASWYIPASAQSLPLAVDPDALDLRFADRTAFGLDLLPGVDAYAMSSRAVRYGVLFVVVPFAVLFLFELLAGARIHPVQYALVGLADAVFFLLLLSLSELMPFAAAYALAALACSGLVASYAVSAIRSPRGLLMLPVLAALYAWLYVSLSSEDYALLLGSAGLFALVAAAMTLTRRIDWYAPRTEARIAERTKRASKDLDLEVP